MYLDNERYIFLSKDQYHTPPLDQIELPIMGDQRTIHISGTFVFINPITPCPKNSVFS
jgi:hypothetical protein